MQTLLEELRTAQQWKQLFADKRSFVTVLNLLPYENPVRLLERSAVANFIAVRRLPRCREAPEFPNTGSDVSVAVPYSAP
jgi:hypothetical protein